MGTGVEILSNFKSSLVLPGADHMETVKEQQHQKAFLFSCIEG